MRLSITRIVALLCLTKDVVGQSSLFTSTDAICTTKYGKTAVQPLPTTTARTTARTIKVLTTTTINTVVTISGSMSTVTSLVLVSTTSTSTLPVVTDTSTTTIDGSTGTSTSNVLTTTTTTLTSTSTTPDFTFTDIASFALRQRGIKYPTTVTCSEHVTLYTTSTVTKFSKGARTSTIYPTTVITTTNTIPTTYKPTDATTLQTITATTTTTVASTSTITSTNTIIVDDEGNTIYPSTTTSTSSTTGTRIYTTTTLDPATLTDGVCISDINGKRPLLYDGLANGYGINEAANHDCSDFCYDRMFKYSGTENGNGCWCGEDIFSYHSGDPSDADYVASGVVVDNSNCQSTCVGEFSGAEKCGGPTALTYYIAMSLAGETDSCNSMRTSMKDAKMMMRRHLGFMRKHKRIMKRYYQVEQGLIDGLRAWHRHIGYRYYVKYVSKIEKRVYAVNDFIKRR